MVPLSLKVTSNLSMYTSILGLSNSPFFSSYASYIFCYLIDIESDLTCNSTKPFHTNRWLAFVQKHLIYDRYTKYSNTKFILNIC